MKITKYPCTFVLLAFVFTFALLLIFLPKKQYSENEKRVLADLPELSFSAIADGSYTKELEGYVSDHFPFRDAFVGVNSYFNLFSGKNGQNGVYVANDGSLVAESGDFDETRCIRNLTILDGFAKKTGVRAMLMAVPTPGYMKRDLLPFGGGEWWDEEIAELAKNNLENTDIIDLYGAFEGKDGVYYNTDHHVTSYGSYLMYKQYCASAGISADESFAPFSLVDGFYGTNYRKSGLWLTKPDIIEIYRPSDESSFSVTVDDISTSKTQNGLYFYSHTQSMDKYPLFLDGNHAVTTIENESNKNGKTLLIIKDSYAHCFATMVCEEYQTVIMVDLRYYRGSVTDLVDQREITDLLFLFGAENLAGMSDIAFLR